MRSTIHFSHILAKANQFKQRRQKTHIDDRIGELAALLDQTHIAEPDLVEATEQAVLSRRDQIAFSDDSWTEEDPWGSEEDPWSSEEELDLSQDEEYEDKKSVRPSNS